MINKRIKFGLALSVELIVVLSIMMTLLSLGTTMTIGMMNSNKATNIIFEYSSISKAVHNFEQNYSYYPGDISNEIFSGKLYSKKLNDMYSIIMTDKDILSSPKTGNIGVAKSMLAFPELSQVGLINFEYNNENVISNCPVLSDLRGQIFINSKAYKSSIWFLWLDSESTTQVIKNSKIYQNYSKYKNKPRLTIFDPSNISDCTIDVQTGIGAISAKVSKIVETKIEIENDANSGKIVADATTNGDCFNANGVYTDNNHVNQITSCSLNFIL